MNSKQLWVGWGVAPAVAVAALLSATPAQADSLRQCRPDTQAKHAYSIFCPTFDVYRADGTPGQMDARLQGRVRTKPYDLIVTPSDVHYASRERQFGGVFNGRRISFVTKAWMPRGPETKYTDRIVARGRWGGRRFVCRATVRNEGPYSTRSDLCTVTTMVPLLGVHYFIFS